MSAMLGLETKDDNEVSMFNRIVRWGEKGIEYEVDPRHVEKLLRDMGMEDCKPCSAPGVKPSTEEAEGFLSQQQTWLDDVRDRRTVDGTSLTLTMF